ncbi:MAG: hypothetical protein LBD30_07495 [Verrucomicrobiales bacterium]|jgi:hypothetical protein|nr:hypothetical protein [Verrucomicrobiales bacterium]
MSAGCGCGNACGCAAKKEKPAAGKPADRKVIKNGKGSAPRNISARFRKNFDGIRWSARRALKPGEKFVKAY